MEKYYVSYSVIEGSSESFYYDKLVEVKNYDDVEAKLKTMLMQEEGINPDEVNVYEILSEIDYFDLQGLRDLDIDEAWD